MDKNPKLNGEQCYGIDLREGGEMDRFSLSLVIDFYARSGRSDDFFTGYFNTLVGNATVRRMIEAGRTEAEIRSTWQEELEAFKARRKKYLLYPDFE